MWYNLFLFILLLSSSFTTASELPESMLSGRGYHVAKEINENLFIWGGLNYLGALGSGAIYNPTKNNWKAISNDGAPKARFNAYSAKAKNGLLVIWGGCIEEGFSEFCRKYLTDGGIYDPSQDLWAPIPSHPDISTVTQPFSVGFNDGILTIVQPSKLISAYKLFRYDIKKDIWITDKIAVAGYTNGYQFGPYFVNFRNYSKSLYITDLTTGDINTINLNNFNGLEDCYFNIKYAANGVKVFFYSRDCAFSLDLESKKIERHINPPFTRRVESTFLFNGDYFFVWGGQEEKDYRNGQTFIPVADMWVYDLNTKSWTKLFENYLGQPIDNNSVDLIILENKVCSWGGSTGFLGEYLNKGVCRVF